MIFFICVTFAIECTLIPSRRLEIRRFDFCMCAILKSRKVYLFACSTVAKWRCRNFYAKAYRRKKTFQLKLVQCFDYKWNMSFIFKKSNIHVLLPSNIFQLNHHSDLQGRILFSPDYIYVLYIRRGTTGYGLHQYLSISYCRYAIDRDY